MTSHHLRLFPVVLAVLLAGCAKHDSRVVALFGGEATLAAMAAPESVEALRIDPSSFGNAPADEKKVIAGYPITSEPVRLSAEQAKELAAILANPGTYSFDSAKGCEFMPGVALRAQAGQQKVVILLCFSCKELAIYVGGKRVGGEDFDNAAGKLTALVKKLFPADKEIQGL
jgi:hypothetical protein